MIAAVLFIDCRVYMGSVTILVLALSFLGAQYSGSLVAHLDLLPLHAGVLVGLVGSLAPAAYFAVPALMRLLVDCTRPGPVGCAAWRLRSLKSFL